MKYENEICSKIESIPKTCWHCNAIAISDLFNLYEKAGFLYAAKKERITPYMSQIQNNWESAQKAGEDILWVVTHEN